MTHHKNIKKHFSHGLGLTEVKLNISRSVTNMRAIPLYHRAAPKTTHGTLACGRSSLCLKTSDLMLNFSKGSLGVGLLWREDGVISFRE